MEGGPMLVRCNWNCQTLSEAPALNGAVQKRGNSKLICLLGEAFYNHFGLHVTIYYPGRKPVPPPLYGGGQRVMYWLGKALIQLGHQVTLIAHPESHIPGAELRALRSDQSGGSDGSKRAESCS